MHRVALICATLFNVTEQIELEHFALRMPVDTLAEVRRLAAKETERNASFMVRKLVDEALAARRRKRTRS